MLKDEIYSILDSLNNKVPTQETISLAHQTIENIFREHELTIYFWLNFDEKTRTISLDPIDNMSRYALIGILKENNLLTFK